MAGPVGFTFCNARWLNYCSRFDSSKCGSRRADRTPKFESCFQSLRILLLNQTFYPDVVSTAQHLSDLAVALAERGHDVTVIASQRAYDDLSRRFPKTETWRGINIHRIGTTAFGKKSKWRRAADFASFIICCCGRLL